jgi:hypothetical protein
LFGSLWLPSSHTPSCTHFYRENGPCVKPQQRSERYREHRYELLKLLFRV